MRLDWFKVREVEAAGVALADHLVPPTGAAAPARLPQVEGKVMHELLRRADREVRTLQLNFFKRAKLANAFKWRLLEKGVEKPIADAVTNSLVMHLLATAGSPAARQSAGAAEVPEGAQDKAGHAKSGSFKQLLAQGNDCFGRGQYAQAISYYQEAVTLKPRSADAHNNLGAVLYKLDRYSEAAEHFRQALKFRPDYPEALNNLGALLQWQGYYAESETALRRALKLRPNYVDARSLLGKTLLLQGRSEDAKSHFAKALKIAPQHPEALLGMGQLATMEGGFQDAEGWFNRALELKEDPRAASALAGLAGLRRMTAADGAWLHRAQQMLAAGLPATEETALRFAMGKYHDDIGDYAQAFQSYKRANEIAKSIAESYRPETRTQFVDDMIRVHTRETVAMVANGASDSNRPIFVVGMPRSGTTLAEQIIASHPAAKGAGELEFWNLAGRKHAAEIRQGGLAESTKKQLAESYLGTLRQQSVDALRIVDKAPVNSDYLGVILSVFPNARIIYMRRNPIDTCLSCYFQPFTLALNFTMDLSDLAHYYREHHRIMAHWRAVLPPGTMLEVRYEELVADQAAWTRKMLDFIGLEWDERCLDFHKTERDIATASTWQVRQRIYRSSVERWRKYEKFIGALKGLRNLDA